MSSYHSYFTYQGRSSIEKGLIVCAFDAESGDTSTFLGMDSVNAENPRTGVRHDYGAKYNEVAVIKITLITFDSSDFSVDRFRDVARWLSGAPKSSWLDLYNNNTLAYSFLCKCVDIQHYKMGARTVGVTATFEAVSPWAYSPVQTIITKVVNGSAAEYGAPIAIDNKSDELYSYLYPNVEFSNVLAYKFVGDGQTTKFMLEDVLDNLMLVTINDKEVQNYSYKEGLIVFDAPPASDSEINILGNFGSTSLSILNKTTDETTIVSNISEDEIVTMSSNQMIFSSKESRIFGEDFNFVWPRLAPGINILCAAGHGTLKITYRYPIKIGDCVMDINANIGEPMCEIAGRRIATEEEVAEVFTDVYNTVFGGIA